MSIGVILIVDDDVEFAEALADGLSVEGFSVIRARNGLDALQQLQHRTPDVILLDLMMPRLDGYGFRERQLRDPRLAEIPVIALTAGAITGRTRSLSAECLAKPFPIERLVEAIHRSSRACPTLHPG